MYFLRDEDKSLVPLFKNGSPQDDIFFDISLFFEMLKPRGKVSAFGYARAYFEEFDFGLYKTQIREFKKEIRLSPNLQLFSELMPSSGQSIKDINSEYENLPKQERDGSEIEDKYIDAVSEAMDLINADLGQTRLKKLLLYNGLPIEFASHFYTLIRISDIKERFSVLLNRFKYLPSIKGHQKRAYQANDSDQMNTIIKSIGQYDEENDFLRKWEKEFKLKGKIKWGSDDKLGVNYVELNEKSLLDYGFGISQITSILLTLDNYRRFHTPKKKMTEVQVRLSPLVIS